VIVQEWCLLVAFQCFRLKDLFFFCNLFTFREGNQFGVSVISLGPLGGGWGMAAAGEGDDCHNCFLH
jgi:hypothetical protein